MQAEALQEHFISSISFAYPVGKLSIKGKKIVW